MKYVSIYGNAMSFNTPHPNVYAKDLTLRYPIIVPFKGSKYRIRLDNFVCKESVCISKVLVSTSSNNDGSSNNNFIKLTCNGNESFNMGPHESVLSDEFYIDIKDDEYLVVTMYLKDYTNLTSAVLIEGPLSKGYFGYGDMSEDTSLNINLSKGTQWFYFLSDIYAYTEESNKALICYGDSITSQAWPEYLYLELRKNHINNVSIIRKAVSGTRVLREYECITYQSYGLKGTKRFNHEISSVEGADKLIILQGINDIIHPVGEDINIFRPMSDLPSSNELADGISYYVNEAKKYNLDTYVGTLLPIYNWRTYCVEKEELKNDFNNILKDRFNIIDFESFVSDYIDSSYRFKDGYDSGDHLHPSKLAYEEMGKKVFEILFK